MVALLPPAILDEFIELLRFEYDQGLCFPRPSRYRSGVQRCRRFGL
jgi:hypothetical protein